MSTLFIAIPLTLFVLFVLPVWLWLHYNNRTASGSLSQNEQQRLLQLTDDAKRMRERIQTLEDILEIVNRQYLLKDFVDPGKFKSYDDLAKKLDTVLNSKPASSAREFESNDSDDDTTQVTQNVTRKVDTKRTSIPTSNSKASLQSDSGDSDDDDGDTMAYFRNLVNDD